MLIDLLTYVCLDRTALISALGFIKKLSQIKQLLVFAVFLATTWHAGVDPNVHNLCKDVSDYMGCVSLRELKYTLFIDV